MMISITIYPNSIIYEYVSPHPTIPPLPDPPGTLKRAGRHDLTTTNNSSDGRAYCWAIVKKQITSKELPRKMKNTCCNNIHQDKKKGWVPHPYVKLYILIFVASQVFWRKSVGLRAHIYCCNGTSPLFGDSVCFFCNRWSGHQKDIPSLLYTFLGTVDCHILEFYI